MKKFYQKFLSILFIGSIGVTAFAQGTWKTPADTIPAIDLSTAIVTGITGLTCMHSDATTILWKKDASTTVTYNGVTWDNLSFVQGNTNGMYFALRTASAGTLDLALKMSANKTFFVCELTATCPDEANLAALTTNNGTGALIYATASNVTFPSVYDTYNNTSTAWNGTNIIVPSAAGTQYMVVSFPVLADKTYIVGVNGSKMMVRGINYKVNPPPSKVADLNAEQKTKIFPNPAKGNVTVKMKNTTNIGIYNAAGSLMKQQLVTPADNNVDISGLTPGVYFIKDMKNKTKLQKLIVK